VVKLKIKKGATVQVTTGADKGKKGAVLEVDPKKMQVKVQGVKVQTHFDKKEGLLKKEGFIDYSNVKLVEKAPEKKTPAKKASKSKSA
jgi:large subunit ribosomal protein L24